MHSISARGCMLAPGKIFQITLPAASLTTKAHSSRLNTSSSIKSSTKDSTRCSNYRPNRSNIIIAKATAANSSSSDITSGHHTLPDGMRLELLTQPGNSPDASSKPPLLFIHGSYHGAWCFAEHFMPFFANAGWDTYALSLRGQGNSDRGNLKVSGDLDSHAADLASVIAALPRPPILIAHSFGGLLAEKYLSLLQTNDSSNLPDIAGVGLVCSVPPSGNKDIVVRITKRNFFTSMKITWAFVGKSFATNIDACRDTFFSPDIPLADLERYQKKLAECSPVRLLDLGALNKVLPLPPLQSENKSVGLKAFAGGGDQDLVVDKEAVEEAAAWLGVEPVMWKGVAHDCMLDTRWKDVAQSLLTWLNKN